MWLGFAIGSPQVCRNPPPFIGGGGKGVRPKTLLGLAAAPFLGLALDRTGLGAQVVRVAL